MIKKYYSLIYWFILAIITILSAFLIVKNSNSDSFYNIFTPFTLNEDEIKEEKSPYPEALKAPETVKGIYLTGYSFSSKTRRGQLIDLIESTELNSMVIDLKDPSGKFMFTPQSEKLINWPLSPASLDNEIYIQILDDLQNRNIYTIARITAFQDPGAVKTFPELVLKNKSGGTWYNWQGITWLDMTNPEAWEIPILQAKEAALIGFDEIQFDYIRFPSDGNTRQISYYNLPADTYKYEILTDFFKYSQKKLEEINIPISIDLFGLTYQRRESEHYDLNIGQRLVDAGKYFDYISPMVYPSHYPQGYLNLANPAAYPYAVVNEALSEGNIILQTATSSIATTRPWLQDFDLGANYDASMVKAQIQACDNNNCSGWLLWNAANVYTVGALLGE